MKVYDAQEMPNIDDPDLIRNCVSVQTMRGTLSALLSHVRSKLTETPFTVQIRVVISMMNRLAEGALSTELLCQKNRVRDAAILLLSLHELRLDLQYIALDPRRADTWIDHTKRNKKPWRVAKEISEIYTVKNELEAEHQLYRQYSMVKHCNPVGHIFAFPVAVDRDSLRLDCATQNSFMVRTHMFALGAHIRCAVVAATKILTDGGIDVGDYTDKIEAQWKTLSKYNEEHIHSMLAGILADTACDNDGSVE